MNYLAQFYNTFFMAATGVDSIDNGLSILKTVVTGIISGVGILIVAWAGFEIGVAIKQHDSAQIPSKIMGLVGGLIMIGIGAFIGLFA